MRDGLNSTVFFLGQRKERASICLVAKMIDALSVYGRTIDHFDKMCLRWDRALTSDEENWFKPYCYKKPNSRRGHPIRNSDADWLITFVAPQPEALSCIARLLKDGFVNYIEVARNWLHDDAESAQAMTWHAAQTFFRSRPGNHQLVLVGDVFPSAPNKKFKRRKFKGEGFYAGQARPGMRFAGYTGAECKRSKHPHVFHFEGRHQGVAAVRRIGIHQPQDLLTFDHSAYQARYWKFYEIDFERLGRLHQLRHGLQPFDSRHSEDSCDHKVGAMLYRIHSAHERQEFRSVQRFFDQYGFGRYAVPVTPRVIERPFF